MEQPGAKVGELCAELGVSPQTLCRHVNPASQLRLDGESCLENFGATRATHLLKRPFTA